MGKKWANDLPLISAFARSIDINTSTILVWKDKHPDFYSAYIKSKELQKEMLIQNGIQGLYSNGFAIFTAKNITDMRDKVEQDTTIHLLPEKIQIEIVRPGDVRDEATDK